MKDNLCGGKDKLLSLLGLCRKANKLVHGFELSAGAIKDGKASLVIITDDTSPKTAKEVKYIAAKAAACTGEKTEIIELAATQDEIENKTGRRAGVLAITDKGLAAAVKKEQAHG